MKKIPFLWIFDVDGTMTDGGVYYDNNGNEFKKFNTRDAAAFFALKEAGCKTMVLTGRECAATKRRMQELGIDFIVQGIKDKKTFVDSFLSEINITYGEVACVGDDLNDLALMNECGFKACPAGACKEIKAVADYISPFDGGQCAVRDIVEAFLVERNMWRVGKSVGV